MPYLLLRVKVASAATWEAVLTDQAPMLHASGAQGEYLLHNAADPHDVVALWAWDDLDRAWLFAQSDELRAMLVRAGVIDQPDLRFLEESGRPP